MAMTSYFSHDSNARNDEKILAVRMKHGAEGYGVYFMILERLRDSEDYTSVADYNLIAFDLRVASGLVKAVIENFGLFSFTEDGKRFYSASFSSRMGIKDSLSNTRREIGRKGLESRWGKKKEEAEPEIAKQQEPVKEEVVPVKEETPAPKPETTPAPEIEYSEFGFQLNTGERYRIPVTDLKEYTRLYPGVDITKEFRNMEGWCMANPKRRKTKQGAKNFITTWLSRTQDSNPQKTIGKSRVTSNDSGISFGEGMIY